MAEQEDTTARDWTSLPVDEQVQPESESAPEATPKRKASRSKVKGKGKSDATKRGKPVNRAGGYVDYGDGRGWRRE